MARTIDAVAHTARREEFLDAAQLLIESQGYARMSVQDVLAEVGTSKGAFYHYFDSKQALLQAVVERNADLLQTHLTPFVDTPDHSALDDLQRFFAALAGWKTQRRDLLTALLRVWYSDDNAVVRHKTRSVVSARIVPLLAAIVGKGVAEGTFTARDPQQTARVLLSLVNDLNDALGELFLTQKPHAPSATRVRPVVAAYTDALERVLGLPSGSLRLVDVVTLAAWFDGGDPVKE
ncbi:TetR/AcrR family transcriptional regulator [Nonomuraea dietziae]|uniref:AcrR family transcriptional regulator n=1 Tax=Nonomuraea dietziae TaxID=65515 RepID=A0A7W5V3X8_9ACTN|nr:TetR/AcrR family transcriptional regulator [Nonomuraea dietziae]MBB3724540.1 AcrR family transcriptional regulator [Nonomuraea dietziae]